MTYNSSPAYVNNCTACSNESISGFTHTPEGYIVPLVFAYIFIVGVVGNGTLIFIVFRNKNMRNVPNIFIVSLAVGDLLLILVSVPFSAIIYTLISWPFGNVLCKFNHFLQALSLGVSVFTLTALSVDRYVAIVDPMKRHRTSSMAVTLGIAAGIWILSAALAIVEVFAAHSRKIDYGPNNSVYICEIHPESWGAWYPKVHVVVRFVIYFAIPIIIIGALYIMMALILVSSQRKFTGEAEGALKSQQVVKQTEARKKVAKVVLSFVVVFMLCWMPRHVYLMWYHFDPGEYNLFWHVFKLFGFCMTFINSCVNPLALYLLSKQFRKRKKSKFLENGKTIKKADCEYASMTNMTRSTATVNPCIRDRATAMTMMTDPTTQC